MEVAELQSTHEEADTILFLHALHAAITGSKIVIVTSEDIDVMLLSKRISHAPSIRRVGHRTAHDLSISANWPGHWEIAYVTT